MRHEPPLRAEQAAHTERVQAFLVHEITVAGGWISFERYMETALYAPGLGYYSAGALKFGRGGDFTTAPEVSGLFGACVARQCAEILRELDRPRILEIGAGTGRLAVDILARLEALECLPERYAILEVSADLRERQRELIESRLPRLFDRVEWLDALPVTPFDGVILANEVLDALPVVRFRWSPASCEELGVVAGENGLALSARAAGAALTGTVNALAAAAGGWEAGYVSEFCPRLGAWAHGVVSALRRGAALWFDYGLPRTQYYVGERHDGTLMCHFRHRAHDDVFLYPGLQDITAWVDFTALAEACLAADCQLFGFTTQAFFLAGLGIEQEMRFLAREDQNRFARLASEARRLMLPGEMGERFKAMAWVRDMDVNLSGFGLQDLRYSL